MDAKAKKERRNIQSQLLKAIFRYSLINEGDRVLVALSGGKDSTLLAYMLKDFSSWFEKKFHLEALNIKTDISCRGCAGSSRIKDFAARQGIPLHIERITLKDKLKEGQEPGCFICSWNRRKAIFNFATSRGFNRVAFGHHRDDFIETALLNLFFSGEFTSISPLQEMFKGKLTLIRPMIFIPEEKITSMVEKLGIERHPCKCPFGEKSKRVWVKNFLKDAEKKNRNLKPNIFRSAFIQVEKLEGGFTPKNRPHFKELALGDKIRR